MVNQITKIQDIQKTFLKKYKDLFRFVEKTGEEIFVFPKKYKVGISLKPIDISRKEFEMKDVLNKIQKGKREYFEGKSEKLERFLKRKYPQYAKIFSENL